MTYTHVIALRRGPDPDAPTATPLEIMIRFRSATRYGTVHAALRACRLLETYDRPEWRLVAFTAVAVDDPDCSGNWVRVGGLVDETA